MNFKEMINHPYDINQAVNCYLEFSPKLSPDELRIRIKSVKATARRREMMRKEKIIKMMVASYQAYLGDKPRHSWSFEEYATDMVKHAEEILNHE